MKPLPASSATAKVAAASSATEEPEIDESDFDDLPF
jgi:hypothetical protein